MSIPILYCYARKLFRKNKNDVLDHYLVLESNSYRIFPAKMAPNMSLLYAHMYNLAYYAQISYRVKKNYPQKHNLQSFH
jgi:hypothetical protein